MELNEQFEYLDSLNIKEENTLEPLTCCSKKENYTVDNGIIKCKCCLNVISNISDNPEWRYYGSSDTKNSDPTRCGMPVNSLLPESSVGSSVSYNKNNKTMNQIRKYQQWNGMPYKERSLYKVFVDIQDTCKKAGLSTKIINEAKSLYKIISTAKISRGANRKGIIAACVYYSCKECGVPRSSKEIADMFSIDITIMTRGCKKCQEIIHQDKGNKSRLCKSVSIKPQNFIQRFCNRLKLDKEVSEQIMNICNIAVENNIISENTPPSIAAGCIFYYSKEYKLNLTKKQISDVCKISEVTINKCTKKIEKEDKLFVNREIYTEKQESD